MLLLQLNYMIEQVSPYTIYISFMDMNVNYIENIFANCIIISPNFS